jgi:hypothetical protein
VTLKLLSIPFHASCLLLFSESHFVTEFAADSVTETNLFILDLLPEPFFLSANVEHLLCISLWVKGSDHASWAWMVHCFLLIEFA